MVSKKKYWHEWIFIFYLGKIDWIFVILNLKLIWPKPKILWLEGKTKHSNKRDLNIDHYHYIDHWPLQEPTKQSVTSHFLKSVFHKFTCSVLVYLDPYISQLTRNKPYTKWLISFWWCIKNCLLPVFWEWKIIISIATVSFEQIKPNSMIKKTSRK